MISIKIDSPDKDINAAIAVLVKSKLTSIGLPVKVEDSIDKDGLNKTMYMSVIAIENKLKVEDVSIVIS